MSRHCDVERGDYIVTEDRKKHKLVEIEHSTIKGFEIAYGRVYQGQRSWHAVALIGQGRCELSKAEGLRVGT
jgi:hypothetical protein